MIRHWYIRDRISIREIARRLDISRNAVRRYIRSDVSEPTYPARCSPSSLDEFTARLSAWLSAEAIKSDLVQLMRFMSSSRSATCFRFAITRSGHRDLVSMANSSKVEQHGKQKPEKGSYPGAHP
ncbi:winged helix-turn-helix transcriptional regulator [Herbaspirillum seropedicae]|uniref:winged helix-turn-helix transcriptional regulator n=1 Tax=Herbaspirillum seropedicae TaxID=964 RepID=UPI00286C9C4B|nr:winged helix-turn-helix transcriptional regulator [Herbaspirillum seropedicae]